MSDRSSTRRAGLRGGALLLAMAMFLSACANMPGSEPLTPAQAALQKSNERFNSTVATGVVVGVVAGALLGALIGRDAGSAALGAAAGGLAGGASGYAVARKNYQQQQTEGNLQAYINEATQNTQSYQQSANYSTQIANDLRQQVSAMDAQYNSGQLTQRQYQAKLATYQKSADTMGSQISKMSEDAANLRYAAATSGYSGQTLSALADQTDLARQQEEQALQLLQGLLARRQPSA